MAGQKADGRELRSSATAGSREMKYRKMQWFMAVRRNAGEHLPLHKLGILGGTLPEI
jgi:putative NADPH-quinone reductase